MDCRMDGRTAIMTGGSMGLGRAIAHEFARSGANVAMVARRQDVLDEAKAEIAADATGKVAGFVCDMSDAAAIGPMFDAVTAALGPADIIVNNAGSSQRDPFLEITDAMWQADLELKLFGAIRLTRLALGLLQRGGDLVMASCSSRVDADAFFDAVTGAAAAGGRPLRMVDKTFHAVDHPVGFAEGAYLKCLYARERGAGRKT